MKRIVNLTALLCLLFGAFTAVYATGTKGNEKKDKDAKARVVVLPSKVYGTYKIMYVGGGSKKVQVNIIGPDGNLVYADRIDNVNGFQKPYNLSNLAEGTYTFEVVDAQGKTTHDIAYRQPSIAAFAFAHTNRYRLIVADDLGQQVFVNIYNANGQLLHTDKVKTGKAFSKIYEVGDGAGNGLTFMVSTNSQTLGSITL